MADKQRKKTREEDAEKKIRMVQIGLPEDMVEEFEKRAEGLHLKLSPYLRMWICQKYEEEKREKGEK